MLRLFSLTASKNNTNVELQKGFTDVSSNLFIIVSFSLAGLLKCYKRLQYQMSGKTGRQNGPHLPVFHNLKQSYQFASRGQCRVSVRVIFSFPSSQTCHF